MLTENILIASTNLVDAGVIHNAFGPGAVGFPMTNLQSRESWLFARFGSPYVGQTKFDVELGEEKALNLLALLKHNCGPLAIWKVSLSSTQAGLDTPDYTSDWLPMHPPVSGYGVLPWGEFEWGGVSPVEQQGFFNRHSFHPLPDTISASWIRYEINDESDVFTRPDSYIQMSRAWASSAYQPSLNVTYGAEIRAIDKTGFIESESLVTFFDKRVIRRREMDISFENIPEKELMYNIFGPIFMKLGKKGELIVMKCPADPESFAYETIYGTLDDVSGVVDSYWRRKSTDMKLKELV